MATQALREPSASVAQHPATSPASAAPTAGWRDVLAVIGERVMQRLRAIFAVFRAAAWILCGLSIVLWVLGMLWGWWELIVVALVVAIVLAVSALFLIGRTTYNIVLDLARTRVVVGERAMGALTLINDGERAILPSRIVMPVGSGRGEFAVSRLAPGETSEELFAIPTHRRGVVQVGPVSIVRGDPFGLFERAHRREEPVDLFVHPRTVRFPGQSLGFVRDLEGLPATDLSRDDVSFHTLNEYQPGDDLRRVHWRSTARTGTLMVRQYEETRRSHFVIGLSTSRREYGSEEEFELAVSLAGSIGLRAVHDSGHVQLRFPGHTVEAAHGKRLLDALAAIDYAPARTGGLTALAHSIAAQLPPSSVVVLVCGAEVSAEQLRQACARMPQGSRVLVLAAHEAAAPALRQIADADVVTVGVLEDLPLALAKVLA
ncbi:DUF58 domain-containing protein [Microbacterium sp. YY-01]|uniref:DUF58 domain-containing protein n=1 Tax=Microbacterium sp. YY-01 TaxID=3421634 RepID=UPI003D182199